MVAIRLAPHQSKLWPCQSLRRALCLSSFLIGRPVQVNNAIQHHSTRQILNSWCRPTWIIPGIVSGLIPKAKYYSRCLQLMLVSDLSSCRAGRIFLPACWCPVACLSVSTSAKIICKHRAGVLAEPRLAMASRHALPHLVVDLDVLVQMHRLYNLNGW